MSEARRIQCCMAETTTNPLVEQLLALLKGGQAHADLDTAIKDFPVETRGKVPAGLPYSAWQLLDHLRITQRDILNFSAPPTGGYHGLKWPDEYWAKSPEPPVGGGLGSGDCDDQGRSEEV